MNSTLLVLAPASVAGCANQTRVVTLNQTTPGAKAEAALQRDLARQGLPAGRVSCPKAIVVDVGAIRSCHVSGRGIVQFTFSNASGAIERASVKGS